MRTFYRNVALCGILLLFALFCVRIATKQNPMKPPQSTTLAVPSLSLRPTTGAKQVAGNKNAAAGVRSLRAESVTPPPYKTVREHDERVERDREEREEREQEFSETEEEDGMMQAMEQEYLRTRSPITGEVPNQELLRAMRVRDEQNRLGRDMAAISGVTWTERGPSNVGGRTRALHFDLNDATYKKVWAGSVAGGIWYTSDISAGTPTWTKVNDFLDNLAVTSIAQSPANKQYFYAATGEGWFNSDAIRGAGVFRSTDGGSTWSLLSSTSVSSLSSTFSYVQKVVVTSAGIVLAGTKYGGLQRSADNGSTWSRVLGNASFSGSSGWGSIADIEIAADGTIYASTGIKYAGGVYRSTDAGATWTQIYTSASDENRIELACAPTASGTVYGLVQKSDNTVKKLMYSSNAGAGTPTWTDVANPTWCDQGSSSTDFTRGQAWYDLSAAVDPNDASTVFVGGVDVLKYNTASSTWTQVSQWASGCSGKPYVHADIHALTFKPSSSTELLVGCDGGIYRTADGGTSFSNRNNGFNVTQFYSVAMHPTNENYFLAGAQDNGTHKFTATGVNSTAQASGGDGGFTHIDATNGNIQISSYVYNYYFVSTNGGSNFSTYNKNSNGQFINPWDYDDNTDILYAASSSGTYFRWSSPATNGTSGEVTVSAFGSAKVTTVAVSPLTANRVYFGMNNGSVIMVDNADGTPTATTLMTGSGSVSCIAVNPADESKMLVTYSNYDITNVYYSSNATAAVPTWTGIDGNLPNMPVRWALFDPRASTKAFLATELGVWSTDAISGSSTNWGSTNGGLANVRVDMLRYNAATMTLTAATHGRGLFSATLCGTTSISSQPTAQSVCSGSSATFTVAAAGAGLTYQWRKAGSNISGATSSSYTIASVAAANAGTYDVVVSGTCGNVTSSSVALSINSTTISTQPAAQSVCTGASASFTVAASGSSLSYQWRKGGTNISGATTATLTLANVSAADAASYDVVVTGSCGSVTSNSAALTINSTGISSQPSAQSVCAGGTATFTVTASGTGLSYQWKKNGSNISGATSATLTLSNVSAADAASYTVTVTGSCGSVTSNAAALTVGSTSITTQPVAQTVCSGSAATFSVVASGTGLSYQWRKGGTNISGATSASYSIASATAADVASYDVVVSSACGSVTSNAAALVLTTATAISAQPAAQIACAGSSATFTVTATGAALSYQWKKDGVNISGATSGSYTIASAGTSDAASYSVTVTGTCGSVTSNVVSLTVNNATAISAQPVAQSVCTGAAASLAVTATGSGLSYQWRKGGTNISGATNATLSFTSVSSGDAGSYDVVVTGSCGTVTSNAAALAVNATTAIGTQPTAQSICTGGSALFTVAASGSALGYQWKKDGAAISGATAPTYFINSATVTDAASYTVTVTGSCGTVTSNAAALAVGTSAAISSQPAAQSVCSGGSATFTVGATGTGLTYQWRKGGSAIAGATAATLTLSNVSATDATSYDVVVTGSCGSVTSSAAALTLTTATSITTGPVAQSVCAGSTASFSVVAAGAGLSYQWKKNGTNISGATTATYSIASVAAANAGTYTVTVTGTCGSVTSSGVALTVNTAAAIGTQPVAQSVCAGTAATFTVAATGTGLTYQWKKDGSNISGATSATYAIANASASEAGSYTVVVTGSCGTVTSNAAALTVNTATSIATQPAAQSACAGSSVSFTVAASGTGLSYQWRKGGATLAGATSATLALSNISSSDAASYDVVVTGTCGTVTSAAAALTVNTTTTISTQPVSQAVCSGSPVSLSVSATGTGLTYQWKKAGVVIPGATAATYSIASAVAADADTYSVNVTGSCGSATSANALLTVNSDASITTQPAPQVVCSGANVSFNVGASGTALTYQWKKNGGNIAGATAATYTIVAATSTDAGTYSVQVTGSCGALQSSDAVLTVNPATSISSGPASVAVCPGSAASFTVAATGSALTYQWKKNGTDIPAATGATYSVSSASASDAATYTVTVTGSCGTITSSAAVLTLNSAPSINSQPASLAVCAGSQASFTVGASGTALSYQWKKDGTVISGATAGTYTVPSVGAAQAGAYTVVVTGTCGTQTSAVANLVINAGTSIGTQPVAQAVCAGSPATFSVTAIGSGALSYQWKKDGNDISGATASSYTIASSNGAAAGVYSVAVSGGCGTVTSAAATLMVNNSTSITTQPVSLAVCNNSAASFSITATGTALSYQWKKNGTDITGATSATYSIPSAGASDAAAYTVVVTGTCGTQTSNAAMLTLNAATVISTQPVSQVLCAGSAATFSVAATGSGTLTYQWKKDGSNITGATAASYTINNSSNGSAGSYSVSVSGGCGAVTSTNATLTVNAGTVINTQPAALTVCAGSNASFTVGATGTALSYQWKKEGSDISGATSGTYSIASVSASDAAAYTVKVSGSCGTVTSSAALLAVHPATVIGTQPVAQTVCSGTDAAFSVGALGTALAYQWNKDGSPVSGATAATFVVPATTAAAGAYTVTVTGACGTVTSAGVPLTVNTVPSITTQPVSQTTCVNTSAGFAVTAGGSGTLAYQWKKNGADISGATGAAYNFGPVTTADAAAYSVVVSNGCGTVASNSVTLSVDACTAVSSLDPNVQASQLLPNVVSDRATLRTTLRRAAVTHWTIFDGNGRAVQQFSLEAQSGSNDFRLSLGSLAGGTYYLVGRTDSGLIGLIRFIRR